MPYKSDAQRRWAHTDSAKKSGFPTNEFDEASKGKKLPEKAPKMAEGGVIPDKSWKDMLKDYMLQHFGKPTPEMGSTLEGFEDLMKHNQDTNSQLNRIDQLEKGGPVPLQGYAQGGVVGQDTDFINQLNQGTVPGLQFNPQAGLPPPPQMPPNVPQMPLQAPNPTNQYIDAQKANLNKFGPEQQLAVEQNLLKQRQSLPQRGAVALGGLADSIMQGVAKAGNPGYAERIQNNQNEQAKEQMGALEKAGTQNIAKTEAEQKLDTMDPSSSLSKIAQQTWGPLLARNGFKPNQIAQMPASAIAALTGQTVEALKAEAEAKMAAASLGLKQQEHETNVAHQKVEEGLGKTNEIMKAGEELRSHPFQRILGVLPGQKGLQDIVSGGESPNQEHQTAIEWAKANPTDPRAQRIMKINGL